MEGCASCLLLSLRGTLPVMELMFGRRAVEDATTAVSFDLLLQMDVAAAFCHGLCCCLPTTRTQRRGFRFLPLHAGTVNLVVATFCFTLNMPPSKATPTTPAMEATTRTTVRNCCPSSLSCSHVRHSFEFSFSFFIRKNKRCRRDKIHHGFHPQIWSTMEAFSNAGWNY